MNEKINLHVKTHFGHFHTQLILTQNIQTSFYIQITSVLIHPNTLNSLLTKINSTKAILATA